MNFSIIAAIDQKRGIGINNKLPWNIKADLKHFAYITINKNPDKQNVVIMGRKTWESLPNKFRPLKDRLNVVLSRQPDLELPEGVLLFTSLDQALTELAKQQDKINEIFIIGGASLYAEAIKHPDCQTIFLTEIMTTYPCDAFFPEIPPTFKINNQSEVKKENDLEFRFLIYERN